MKRVTTLLALALLATSCASGGASGKDLGGPPRNFEGFPSQSLEGVVYAQAALDLGVVGSKLLENGIVPIQLTVSLSGVGRDDYQVLLKPERMNPRLYLADGTSLRLLSTARVVDGMRDRDAKLIRQKALKGGLVSSDAMHGILFFALTPEKAFATGARTVTHTYNDLSRKLKLTHSLLSFNVTVGDTQQPFYVGIQR